MLRRGRYGVRAERSGDAAADRGEDLGHGLPRLGPDHDGLRDDERPSEGQRECRDRGELRADPFDHRADGAGFLLVGVAELLQGEGQPHDGD
jgi:hypothetical protein